MAARNFSTMLDPLAHVPKEVWQQSRRVMPLWPINSNVSVEVAISSLATLSADMMRNETAYRPTTVIAWRESGFHLSDKSSSSDGKSISLDLHSASRPPAEPVVATRHSWLLSLFVGDGNEPTPTPLALPDAAWDSLQANGTLYLHAAVYLQGTSARWRGLADSEIKRTVRLPPLSLVKYEPPPTGRKALPKRKLLADFGIMIGPPAPWSPPPPPPGTFVAKWKPEAAVRMVAEFREWPAVMQMPGMERIRRRLPGGGRVEYYAPPTFADEIGLTSDKYVALNNSLASVPLKIAFSPMSFARWQLMSRMEDSLRTQQRDFGFTDNDIDDVRRLIADTQTWLLAVTIVASALHLLFEFLAFKSDIEFWRNNKSLTGLSARSVIVELISQCVVLAFLIDEGSSLLVSVPAAFGIVIQCWKVRKATGLTFDRTAPFFLACPRLRADAGDSVSDASRELLETTQRVDAVATTYLSAVLLPLVFGWALKTLVYDAHKGWYSWALGSATASVYTFGFILMTPQLALNYTLKSVSHLPWKLLCYRSINTFVDDLFAFIIKMPTMHRVSCFRDDLVFLIYVYQRHIYPVDLARGTAAEDCAH
ncbi:hypothetical protein CTAYLR_005740 [Chrysophaeum taylorii]|uniref:Cleft lip and palate associated transmembrane protein n=1 Tax=Chrysophaeum taylorii TaxID=2483200 RepID=A0AAD7UJB6_9STRA|nr:hypothetical protein CTAYLR_005740 [Chrysophaeum taylorii]